jgi:hypothetical protein
MPACNRCKKFSNCLTVDFCEHCGAKDWDTKCDRARATARSIDSGCTTGFLALIAGAFGIILYLAIAAAGLWILVAVVKWMWEHS